MALYSYQAFSKQGKKVTGQIEAQSKQAVKEQLSRQGIFPIKISATNQESNINFISRLFAGKVTLKSKILFTRQLSVLIKSGIPLLESLELLVNNFEEPLKSILIKIKDDIKEGASFADSLTKFPKTFDNIYIQLIRAGEASGKLEIILDRLTQYAERNAEIKKKISGAMTYPMIQLSISAVVITFLITYIVPQMAENFSEMGKDLPWSTQLLINLSTILTNYFVLILGLFSGLFFGLKYWGSTQFGRETIDKIKLKIPIIRFFTRIGSVVQFCRTLGMLIESGVILSQALDIVVKIIDNTVLANTLKVARDKIIKQGKIAQYLKQTNMFPPIAIYLIKTGEESGKLDKMLLTVAKDYEEDLTELADNLTSKISPIMLLFMAIIVGFIVISIAVPMMQQADVGI